MSVQIIKSQIIRFLETDIPEVIAIRGKWGIGKTFTWNKYLKDAKDKIKLENYSYVSLFGINSLDSLKQAIFMESMTKKNIGIEQEVNNIRYYDKIISSISRKGLKFLEGLPFAHNLSSSIESLAFFSLRKMIICIDDFERKGKMLDAQDVMGLISQLKEQKKCKIVLILNDESLTDTSLIDYAKYREKVIDIELLFNPSAQECAEIALLNDMVSMKLKDLIIKLGINNIRIIKKIERLTNIIIPVLKNCEEEIIYQAIHSLALFAWCFYNSTDEKVPNFDFVKNIGYRSTLNLGNKNKSETEEEKHWKAILSKYNYLNTDDFDLQIATTVEHGYVNEKSFLDEAMKLNEQIITSKAQNSIREAWLFYIESFNNNENEVVSKLYDVSKSNLKHMSPSELDAIVDFLRELNKNDLADEIIDLFINERKNENIFSINTSFIRNRIKDKTIIEKFANLNQQYIEDKTLANGLEKIAGKNGWNPEDIEILINASTDDYYNHFKSQKGAKLSLHVNTCLEFGRFTGDDSEKLKKIAEKAALALKKIGKENILNAMRVRSYGIEI